MANRRRLDFHWRRFFERLFQLMCVLSLLSACASIDSSPAVSTVVSTSSPAIFFSMQGRISVRVGDKIESGQIRWTRLPDEERVALFTPFGNQVAEMVKADDRAVTLRRGQELVSANSVDELTTGIFGVPLDMDAIAAWTQGVNLVEGEPSLRRVGNGDEWQVVVERLQVRGAHRFASRLSAVRGDTVVRLVIDEWQAK